MEQDPDLLFHEMDPDQNETEMLRILKKIMNGLLRYKLRQDLPIQHLWRRKGPRLKKEIQLRTQKLRNVQGKNYVTFKVDQLSQRENKCSSAA